MIHLTYFLLGCLAGGIAVAFVVVAHEADRIGRPPRRTDDR